MKKNTLNRGKESVLKDYCSLQVEEVVAECKTDTEHGLTNEEAQTRLKQFGKNVLISQKSFSTWTIFFHQFSSPLIWFLLVGALIAGLLGEWVQMGAISAIVLLNAFLSFFQEHNAEKSFEALKQYSVPTAKILRGGKAQVLPSETIVPGDLVLLEAGDIVAADGRLVYVAQLSIQEAALTGESAAVYKVVEPVKAHSLGDKKNMAFSGTHVLTGRGKLLVTHTGSHTELGKIAASLEKHTREPTPLQIRFRDLGKQLMLICIAILISMALLAFWKGEGLVQIALTSLSLAVATIPEGLPAVITVALSIGVRRMAKRNVLMRRLASVETLGCTSVICADKTGTITKNEMMVSHLWTSGKVFDFSGTGYEPKGEILLEGQPVDVQKFPELMMALKVGLLCNQAELFEEGGSWKAVGDPMEGALLVAAAKGNLQRETVKQSIKFIGEVPFDSERKRMSVLCSDSFLYVKGALEVVLALCETCMWEDKEIPLEEGKKEEILEAHHRLADQGFRILGLAKRQVEGLQPLDPSLEQKLQFVGFVAIIDPPREGVKEAISSCREAKMIPVMITGDHKKTALAIAQKIGLMQDGFQALEGSELDAMDDATFQNQIVRTSVFARVSAEHKLRIVRSWKSLGHVVAMTGDGVNDAPAVTHADIGISMGVMGTEVTKKASDMVILDDHFATIVEAVKEGRCIYANILKFVHFLLSANFAELVVITLGILFTEKGTLGMAWAALLPAQILWINLVTDGFPAIALAFDPVTEQAMKESPRKLAEPILPMRWIGRLVTLGCVAALASIFVGYLGGGKNFSVKQTMVFTELVLLEFGILFLIRLPLSVFSNWKLLAAVLFSFFLQLLVIYVPWMRIGFGTTMLQLSQWIYLVGTALLASVCMLFVLRIMRRKRV